MTARDGGQAELLARSEGELGLWNPCWLPDGRTILYSHTGHLTPHDLGIFRLDLTTRAVALLPGTERLQYPPCSPRGDILAIENPPEGPPAWSVSFAERDRWERLGPADIGYPAWSPDGQSFTGLDAASPSGRALVPRHRSVRDRAWRARSGNGPSFG